MSKRIALVLCLAAMLGALSLSAAEQKGIIKGVCKDESGKPMAGATMEIANQESGSSIKVTTEKDGSFATPALDAGMYKLTLMGSDGKPMYFISDVPARAGSQTNVDFDLAKLKAEDTARARAIEEQRKENEKIEKENEKIHQVNALLQQAAQQKKDKQYDAAVTTMEQAAAMDETHDVVYGALADAYSLDKKFPQAEAAYQKAIAMAAPNSKLLASYHAGMALTLLEQNKIEESRNECDKLVSLDARLAGQCYYNEGATLTNQGKADAADRAFDRSIAVDPTRADAYYQKGVNLLSKATLSKDNRLTPAPGTAEAFRKYLELAPTGTYAQNARDLLASIGETVEATYSKQKTDGKKK